MKGMIIKQYGKMPMQRIDVTTPEIGDNVLADIHQAPNAVA